MERGDRRQDQSFGKVAGCSATEVVGFTERRARGGGAIACLAGDLVHAIAPKVGEARWASGSHAVTRWNTETPSARSSLSRSLPGSNTNRLIDSFDSFSRSSRVSARSKRVSDVETIATSTS